MMIDPEHSDGPEADSSEESKSTMSRQQLLKAGWVVPAVMAINLPTAVQAQTAVPTESEPEATEPEVKTPAPVVKPPMKKVPAPTVPLPTSPLPGG